MSEIKIFFGFGLNYRYIGS